MEAAHTSVGCTAGRPTIRQFQPGSGPASSMGETEAINSRLEDGVGYP
jgi:hypothetical protein